jgi:hypothetical protein
LNSNFDWFRNRKERENRIGKTKPKTQTHSKPKPKTQPLSLVRPKPTRQPSNPTRGPSSLLSLSPLPPQPSSGPASFSPPTARPRTSARSPALVQRHIRLHARLLSAGNAGPPVSAPPRHPARLSRALSLPHGPEASAPARARQPLTARTPLSDPSPSPAQRPAEITGRKSRRGSKPGRARPGWPPPYKLGPEPLLSPIHAPQRHTRTLAAASRHPAAQRICAAAATSPRHAAVDPGLRCSSTTPKLSRSGSQTPPGTPPPVRGVCSCFPFGRRLDSPLNPAVVGSSRHPDPIQISVSPALLPAIPCATLIRP